MLNEVLRLIKGDLTNVIKDKEEEQDETERNNEAFYKDYQGENHVKSIRRSNSTNKSH